MWRPARVPIRYSGYPNLGQQEPAPTPAPAPAPERASWEAEVAVGMAVGTVAAWLSALALGQPKPTSVMAPGAGAGFVVANILRLL